MTLVLGVLFVDVSLVNISYTARHIIYNLKVAVHVPIFRMNAKKWKIK